MESCNAEHAVKQSLLVPLVRHEGAPGCCSLPNGERVDKILINPLFAAQDLFPFKEYFADAPGVLFKGEDFEADMERAKGCWRHLRTMFQELEECRAFELLKVRILKTFRMQCLNHPKCNPKRL